MEEVLVASFHEALSGGGTINSTIACIWKVKIPFGFPWRHPYVGKFGELQDDYCQWLPLLLG